MRLAAALAVLCCLAAAVPCAAGPAAGARPKVCIDPGHPSETSRGMALRDGTTEVHVAWDVALRLRRLLEARGIGVGMTKSAERQLVRNRDRAGIANAMHAALMVRLHCDSGGRRGFALYYPDRQGRSGGAVGPPVSVREASRRAAGVMSTVMARDLAGQIPSRGVLGDTRTRVGGRQGALTGSVYARVPVVTIEMAVLTNGRDAAFMRTEQGREAMARAISDGVERFVRPGLGAAAPDGHR